MPQFWSLLLLFFLALTIANAATNFSIMSFGATPDGKTDSADALLKAWEAACGASGPTTVIVPKARFFISKGSFYGPCNSSAIEILIQGSLVAHAITDKSQTWLVFRYVDGLTINGGALDGRGAEIWGCKLEGNKDQCPIGAATLSLNHCMNVHINGVTLINSQAFHVSIYASINIHIQNSTILAPGNSPNTDGVHIGYSTGVSITSTRIGTGDDCISIGQGSTNVNIDSVSCGPGHGISIGSLGGLLSEPGVRNVTVTRVALLDTTNGFRIKSYGRPSNGFVDGASFRHAIMRNVQNPIIIDQNYCPSTTDCPTNSSGVSIRNVAFSNIQGTSATPVAINLDCSPLHPCSGLELKNIDLTYQNQTAQSFCRYANGSKIGYVIPQVTCF